MNLVWIYLYCFKLDLRHPEQERPSGIVTLNFIECRLTSVITRIFLNTLLEFILEFYFRKTWGKYDETRFNFGSNRRWATIFIMGESGNDDRIFNLASLLFTSNRKVSSNNCLQMALCDFDAN